MLVAQNVDEGVVLLRGDQLDHYWILRGVCCDDEGESSESDDEGSESNYSMSPTAKALSLFQAIIRKEQPEGGDVESWVQGGIVPKIAKGMRANGSAAKSVVENLTYTQLQSNTKLSFVYDLVDASRPFQSLNYVRNAAQRPLADLPESEFVAKYGISRALCFQEAKVREAAEHDWWSEIYA